MSTQYASDLDDIHLIDLTWREADAARAEIAALIEQHVDAAKQATYAAKISQEAAAAWELRYQQAAAERDMLAERLAEVRAVWQLWRALPRVACLAQLAQLLEVGDATN